jgi:excisionase family DNA binding protein
MSSADAPNEVERPKRPGSLQDAAREFSVSVDSIRRMIAKGEIRAWRYGPPRGRSIVRVDLDEVAALFVLIPTVNNAASSQ